MAPPPFAAIAGANARVTASVPKKCVSISSRSFSRSPSSSDAPVPTPALLTRSVTSPAASAAAATEAWSVMSSATGTAPGRVTEAGSRAPAYTRAPRLISSAARARPKPRLAPVTRAVLAEMSMTAPEGKHGAG